MAPALPKSVTWGITVRSSTSLDLSCLRCKMRIVATGSFIQAGAEHDALLRPGMQ